MQLPGFVWSGTFRSRVRSPKPGWPGRRLVKYFRPLVSYCSPKILSPTCHFCSIYHDSYCTYQFYLKNQVSLLRIEQALSQISQARGWSRVCELGSFSCQQKYCINWSNADPFAMYPSTSSISQRLHGDARSFTIGPTVWSLCRAPKGLQLCAVGIPCHDPQNVPVRVANRILWKPDASVTMLLFFWTQLDVIGIETSSSARGVGSGWYFLFWCSAICPSGRRGISGAALLALWPLSGGFWDVCFLLLKRHSFVPLG